MIEKSVAAQWSAARKQSTPSQPSSGDEISPVPAVESTLRPESEKSPAAKRIIQLLPPMIALFQVPRLLVSLFGCFVQTVSLASFGSVLPLYVKDTFHWNSSGAGLIFICLVIPQFIATLFRFVSDRAWPTGTHHHRSLRRHPLLGLPALHHL